MHFRLRLLLLAGLTAGAVVLSGVAAAPPAAASGRDLTIIIRPVEPAPAPAPEPVLAAEGREPAPALSPKPDMPEEWVVTHSGRFQALPADPSPAVVDAAVAEELVPAEPEGGATAGALARYAVDAIFPVATPEPAASQSEVPVAAGGTGGPSAADDPSAVRDQAATAATLKLQAPSGRDAAQQRAAGPRSEDRGSAGKTTSAARRSTPAPAGTRAGKGAASEAGKKTAGNRAKQRRAQQQRRAAKPSRAKAGKAQAKNRTAAQVKNRKPARASRASVRRQGEIRKATAHVKRALRSAAAKRRRAKIPAALIIDVPVRKVRGIVVHRRIAGRTAALLAAADRANLRLNGWGYRSTQRQIQLRRQHCGKSRYAMYRMPSGRCWPPTAPPGKSLHERGLAIDFYVEGRKGKALPIAGTREFRWLKRNAAKYGFYNLPSEAWHWSTTGR